jgi:hypothetical protein
MHAEVFLRIGDSSPAANDPVGGTTAGPRPRLSLREGAPRLEHWVREAGDGSIYGEIVRQYLVR